MNILIHQGSVKVSSVHLLQVSDEVILVDIQSDTKRPRVSCTSGCCLYLDSEVPVGDLTSVEVVGLEGWQLYAAEAGNWHVSMVLIQDITQKRVIHTPTILEIPPPSSPDQ